MEETDCDSEFLAVQDIKDHNLAKMLADTWEETQQNITYYKQAYLASLARFVVYPYTHQRYGMCSLYCITSKVGDHSHKMLSLKMNIGEVKVLFLVT